MASTVLTRVRRFQEKAASPWTDSHVRTLLNVDPVQRVSAHSIVVDGARIGPRC